MSVSASSVRSYARNAVSPFTEISKRLFVLLSITEGTADAGTSPMDAGLDGIGWRVAGREGLFKRFVELRVVDRSLRHVFSLSDVQRIDLSRRPLLKQGFAERAMDPTET